MSMGDTDWRPDADGNRTRRIGKPHPIEYYELMEYDGGEGTNNRPSGFIVSDVQLANNWVKQVNGRSYRRMKGIYVQRLEDIPAAQDALKRQKALDKLTEDDKKLLGLA